jgi:hypothetical protein
MYRRRHTKTPASRRGLVLLVVLSLLTLFMIVGLTFVFYADNELQSSINADNSGRVSQPDLDPETACWLALQQIIYGVNSGAPGNGLAPGYSNDADGVYSALRGHELARVMYGFRDDLGADNSWPFSGIGRLHQPSFLSTVPTVGAQGQDDFNLVNYTYWPLVYPTQPAGPNNPSLQVRDPERLGLRVSPQTAYAANSFIGTANPPYTYPDLNNMLLAAVDSNGNVLAISGHRDYLFNPGTTLNDTSNQNWTNVEGKYLTLRPRPADNPAIVVSGATKPGFPYPEDADGDVKNLIGGPGGNDSIWIDIGAPVQTLPDGRKYKMLIAPLILDMDGRVNLNAHGNTMALNRGHASNQGLGKWEINLSKVLNADNPANPQEWKQIFQNAGTGAYPQVTGRYGIDGAPNMAGSSPSWLWRSPYYSQLDVNAMQDQGANAGQPSSPLQVPIYGNPAPANSLPLSLFPSMLNVANGYSDGQSPELLNHALGFNLFLPGGDDRIFAASHMEAILRFGDTNSPALTSDLFRLLPKNMSNAQVRRLITTHSFDVDRPGITPYIWDPTDPVTKYTLQATPNGTYPRGSPITFPPVAQRGATPPNSEFDPATWRAISTALGRIDLNSIKGFITYPTPGATGAINLGGPPDPQYPQFNTAQDQFNAAHGQRQQMARNIYTALRAATGAIADPPNAPNPETTANADFQALRWLAQLSVNIVDYIDYDDISTPFKWYTDPTTNKPYYVFGTELPRVVLNEAYAEISNDPTDNAAPPAKPFRVKFWVELYNPLSAPVAGGAVPADDGSARLQVPANAGVNQAYAVYQVAITAGPNTNLGQPDNVVGDPDSGGAGPPANPNLKLVESDYTPPPGFTPAAGVDPNVIKPNTGAYAAPTNGGNQGFYMLGPKEDFPSDPAGVPVPALPTPTLRVADPNPLTSATNPNWVTSAYQTPTITAFESSMVYTVPNTVIPDQIAPHSILLRRLACPNLPPQLDPTQANYNPYITVDYLDSIKPIDAVQFLPGGPNPFPTPVATRTSMGRREPYAAAAAQFIPQTPNNNGNPNTFQPQHTFFRHNGVEAAPANNNPDPAATGPKGATQPQTLQIPFHWLTHLNRQLVSPGELLQVSGYKPHELTHQFVTGAALPGVPYRHTAPWFDQASRLYRALELLETGDRAAGMSVGGRLAGKININTLWPLQDPNTGAIMNPVWRALCDAQTPTNNFTQQQIDTIFQNLVTRRSPSLLVNGALSATDRPFLGMAPGPSANADPQYPQLVGIDNTLFASTNGNATDPRMFGVPVTLPPTDPNYPNQAHPYQQSALMTKIFSNVTTRSNVFAVYITVGFFEVNDDTVRPVKLGAELNRSENRHVRHRMFALVDRTSLTAYGTTSQGAMLQPPGPGQLPSPQLLTVTLGATSGVDARTGRQWQIQARTATQRGTLLVFDPNDPSGNEETVEVLTMPAANQITAVFNKTHPAGAVINRGNPGPWQRYDPRQDTAVVPYFSIID